ncbi:MAG: glycosyltransferase [Acidobacteria bacterium]|nr:glycosyltransferase [Acidobacteriota bacterium]
MKERRIKILHVIDSLAIGGMERVVIDVVNGMDNGIFEQAVCCLSQRGEGAGWLRDGTVCYDLGKGAGPDRLMPLKIASVLRAYRPDIIHSQSWSGVDTALAKLIAHSRARLIQSEHGRSFPFVDGESLKRRLARRCLYQLSDAVFAVSDEVRDYYCRETGFPIGRMQVIRNGIDVRRIDSADPAHAREELGFSRGDFVIGTVARLDRTKDTITLLHAFDALTRMTDRRGVRLLIVGEGDERVRLERFVAERSLADQVVFAGERTDVPRLLKAMDVFALSSITEGMPITVLEAMSASLPVVATGVGALPEMVIEGSTGYLVRPRDHVALAEGLAKIVNHPDSGRECGRAGRRKVERDYTLDRMLGRYRDLYLYLAK